MERVGPEPRARLKSGFAFFLGDLCRGPPRGAKVTFARPGVAGTRGPAGVRFLLVDGVTAGTWSRAKHGKRFEVHVTPIRRLAKRQRERLEAEVARIGAFLGLEPLLTVD